MLLRPGWTATGLDQPSSRWDGSHIDTAQVPGASPCTGTFAVKPLSPCGVTGSVTALPPSLCSRTLSAETGPAASFQLPETSSCEGIDDDQRTLSTCSLSATLCIFSPMSRVRLLYGFV